MPLGERTTTEFSVWRKPGDSGAAAGSCLVTAIRYWSSVDLRHARSQSFAAENPVAERIARHMSRRGSCIAALYLKSRSSGRFDQRFQAVECGIPLRGDVVDALAGGFKRLGF